MSREITERLLVFGPGALLDHELVLVVAGGRSHPVAVDDLARCDVADLVERGFTRSQVARLTAATELGRRALAPRATSVRIRNALDVYELLRPRLVLEDREHLVVISLDRRQGLLAVDTASLGSSGFTIVDPPTVFRFALRRGAHAIVLAHNHPSGDPAPSRQDIDVTHRVTAAGRVLWIEVLDHVVVARGGRPVAARRLDRRGVRLPSSQDPGAAPCARP
ncbi:MAG: JAB domain-containing protein [Thermoanaerobaculia bacterium]|jgi:DNA repair protein RadC